MPLFEIVPNLSEGRKSEVIDAAVRAVNATGARVLHRTSDEAHHRSVLTIVGTASAVVDASVALAGVATESIDLRTHAGVHPRIGALDVLPFVPLDGASLAEAARLAHEAAHRIWETYRVPSFYYGAAAIKPERLLLPNVRADKGDPDVGTIKRHASAGAIAVGARDVLVAINVDLATGDLTIAKAIATQIREKNGGLASLRALGFRLSPTVVQVSMNVTDYEATPLYRVVEIVRRLAAANGVEVVRTELIGCLPQRAVEQSARYYLGV